jgi:hypothetical protein
VIVIVAAVAILLNAWHDRSHDVSILGDADVFDAQRRLRATLAIRSIVRCNEVDVSASSGSVP